jgi:hypothetical protein
LVYYKLRWNKRQKGMERIILRQALPEPPPTTASKPLPPAKPLLPKPLPTPPTAHPFVTIPTLPSNIPTRPQLPSTPSTSITQFTTALQPYLFPEPQNPQMQKENIQERLASTHASTGSFPKTKDFGDSKHIVDTWIPFVLLWKETNLGQKKRGWRPGKW